MNTDRLHIIFEKYIDNYDFFNDEDHDEHYKWEIAQIFQSFDLDAEDFSKELLRVQKSTYNFIDSGHTLPMTGLVEFAKLEPETVREMFKNLYSDDNGDLNLKQKKINDFIETSEMLRTKYFSDSHLYINNQRSAMQYLFLRDPDNNYAYKATQAKRFADCIEYFDDWGPMTDFNIEIYYRMCNFLVEEIKKCPELIAKHNSRYSNTERKLHPDSELHILAFDIIYTSQSYDFYDGMDFTPINAAERKLHEWRMEMAKKCHKSLLEARAEKDELDYILDFIKKNYTVGTHIRHKIFREGIISEINDKTVAKVNFNGAEKTLVLKMMLAKDIILIDDEYVKGIIDKYKKTLEREKAIRDNLYNAEKEFEEYAAYLS